MNTSEEEKFDLPPQPPYTYKRQKYIRPRKQSEPYTRTLPTGNLLNNDWCISGNQVFL